MSKVKFRDLKFRTRIYRILNLSLNFAIILFLAGLAVYYFLTNNTDNRQYASIGVIGFSFLPLVFELIFRKRIPNTMYLFVNIYIIFAGVIVSALSFYANIAWFDIVIHSFMGYFAGAVGLFVLCASGDEKTMKIWTIALFCLSFSLFVEGVWELFEFAIDLIFPTMEMQGVNFEGQAFPLVTDTMVDIFCNFCGAVVFVLHFVLAKLTKKNLGIESMAREFYSYKEK